MRILLASDTYYPSVNGAAYFTYRLALGLVERGHEVFVMAPSQDFHDRTFDHNGIHTIHIRSVHIPVYPEFRVSTVFLAKQAMRTSIQEAKPDVIHIQNHFFIGKEVLKIAKEFNIPIMGTNHFMPENLIHYFHLPYKLEHKIKNIGWKQFLAVYNELALVTAPTQTAANMIKKLGFEHDVTPISCGIDLTRFQINNDGSALRQKYNIPEGRTVLLYVGRLDREKRIDMTIAALPEVAKHANVHFVIAGMGNIRTELEQKAGEIGLADRVTFTGFVPDEDIAYIYRVADIFVMTGIAELQSIATMEAMASGLPIVAVDAVALPELVHDGQNGFLFAPDNVPMLADCLTKLCTDPKLRQKMSQASLEIIQTHDFRTIIARYEDIYEHVTKAHEVEETIPN